MSGSDVYKRQEEGRIENQAVPIPIVQMGKMCIRDRDGEILRNILYAGVWTKYNKIQKERNEGKERGNGK